MISRPCLRAVDFDQEFIVTCDASESHFGSCLSQKGPDGIERPCAYASKLLSEKESRQSPGMRERAALLFSLRHWKPYLIGKEFVLRTDHKPNVAIADSKTKTYDTLSDEIMQFQQFRMEYLRGDKMFADALSRPPSTTTCLVDSSDKSYKFADLIKAQRSDPLLCHLGKTDPLPPPLTQTRNGIYHSDGRLFVPRSFVKNILYTCHDKAGHFSTPYVRHAVARSCFWPTMISDISNYVLFSFL